MFLLVATSKDASIQRRILVLLVTAAQCTAEAYHAISGIGR